MVVRGETIALKTATTKRASRAARPSEPSLAAYLTATALAREAELVLKAEGRTKLTATEGGWRAGGAVGFQVTGGAVASMPAIASGSGGKGPSVRALHEQEQQRTNHVAALKARHVDSKNFDPSWVLNGLAAPQCYDKLVEAALSSNAVNDSVTKRRDTQGAALQSTRVPGRGIGGAAAAQCVQVEVALALARLGAGLAGGNGVGHRVVDPVATNAADAAALWRLPVNQCGDHKHAPQHALLGVVSSASLVYNSAPTKLSAASIRTGARWLASNELRRELISERVTSNHMLRALCLAVTGGYEIDSLWACIVLVVVVASDPNSRPLLNDAGLTDIDLQIAITLEMYGRAEVTRRVRMDGRQGADTQSAASVAGDDEEEPPTTSDANAASPREKGLAAKKKRGNAGVPTAATSDSYGMLRWWFDALRSEYRSVLETLIAQSRTSAREASREQLDRQSEGSSVAQNRVIQELSASNAVRSAEALAPLVSRKPSDTPAWVAMRDRKGATLLGTVRMPNASVAPTLHAARVLRAELQPQAAVALAVAHSIASQGLLPRGAATALAPGVFERQALMHELHAGSDAAATKGALKGHAIREAAAYERYTCLEAQWPLPPDVSGLTRSFLSMAMPIWVPKGTWDAAVEMAREGNLLATRTAEEHKATHALPRGVPEIAYTSQGETNKRLEPLCTPCPRLAIGISTCELLRRLRAGRTRKNEPTKVRLGQAASSDTTRDAPLINDAEPLPMAVITDFTLTARCDAADAAYASANDRVNFDAAVHVCLDGAVRLPELLRQVADDGIDATRYARALLYAGANHASFISDLGAVVRAGLANAAINSSKKVATSDTNTWLGLSAWDVYAGGLNNQRRLAEGSAYSGCYTSPVDHGVSGPGLLAHYLASDRRQHGSLCLSEEAADAIAARMAEHHYVPVGSKRYTTAPSLARGLPHGLYPGIHSAMADYAAALEDWREVTGREGAATTDGLFALPFSGVTQALAPGVEATADPTLRHGFRVPEQLSAATGRSYLADATAEQDALLSEPLFKRPTQVSIGDNPFNTAYEHMDGFWNAANTLVLLATCANPGDGAMDCLRAAIDTFHNISTDADGDEQHGDAEHLFYASDACVLIFGALYPSTWSINEPMVPDVYARAAALQAARVRRGVAPGRLKDLVDAEALADAQQRWAAFQRRGETCAWDGALLPLLKELHDWAGSHNVDEARLGALRTSLEQAVRGAWLVHSPDGVTPPPAPCPAAHCAGPAEVRRPTIDPRFVASGDELEFDARGALVGIKPHQLRQLYALLMGAHLPDVQVQVVRNEGARKNAP